MTLRSAFRFASMLVFFGLLGALILFSITADIILLGILAGVIVSQMLYVILPMQDIRARAKKLYSGEAGEAVYEDLEERGGKLR